MLVKKNNLFIFCKKNHLKQNEFVEWKTIECNLVLFLKICVALKENLIVIIGKEKIRPRACPL